MHKVMKYSVALVKESAKTYDVSNVIDASSKAAPFIRKVFTPENWHNEKFGMVCLDAQNKVIGTHIVFEGSLSETVIFPREVAVRALLNNAVSVIIFHNHPGGLSRPSPQDVTVTNKIKEALNTLQITLLDHVLLADRDVTFAEQGLL